MNEEVILELLSEIDEKYIADTGNKRMEYYNSVSASKSKSKMTFKMKQIILYAAVLSLIALIVAVPLSVSKSKSKNTIILPSESVTINSQPTQMQTATTDITTGSQTNYIPTIWCALSDFPFVIAEISEVNEYSRHIKCKIIYSFETEMLVKRAKSQFIRIYGYEPEIVPFEKASEIYVDTADIALLKKEKTILFHVQRWTVKDNKIIFGPAVNEREGIIDYLSIVDGKLMIDDWMRDTESFSILDDIADHAEMIRQSERYNDRYIELRSELDKIRFEDGMTVNEIKEAFAACKAVADFIVNK